MIRRFSRWFRIGPWKKLSVSDRLVLDKLQALIGVTVFTPTLYIQALKHRSYLNVTNEKHFCSYERLEFLGDAILNTVTADFLFIRYSREDEGFLTKAKSLLVNKKTLAQRAEAMGLGPLVLMSEGEVRSGGRARASILADVFEALLGAIYLDRGFIVVNKFIVDQILCNADTIIRNEMNSNFKGDLLEYTQGHNLGIPLYSVAEEIGPEHQKKFTINVLIKEKLLGTGTGMSKKEAEQNAAREALVKIKQTDFSINEVQT